MSRTVLATQGLFKKYEGNDHFAVDDVSLQINQGEIIALLGESGSGKTTLLRLIAGFERANGGSLIVNQQTFIDAHTFAPPEKRNIGMVFQDYALFPHLTVAKNVAYGIKGDKQKKQIIITEMLELVGLGEFRDRYPHQLSGGQQQRVALARALATKPHVLLLDEPFSNLDEALKEQVRNDLKSILNQSKITAIFVTHDTRDALAVADRIAILKDGKLQQFDTPTALYQQPDNQYVAQYFGKVNWFSVYVNPTELVTSFGQFARPELLSLPEGQYRLGIRPEHIRVANSADAMFHATVSQCKYFGNYQAVSLDLGDVQLIAHLDCNEPLEVGSQIPLVFHTESFIFLAV